LNLQALHACVTKFHSRGSDALHLSVLPVRLHLENSRSTETRRAFKCSYIFTFVSNSALFIIGVTSIN
jgi:hypothetical protein